MMKRLTTFRFSTLVAGLGVAACFCFDLAAQDVAITNARIVTVTGPVIESGTIVVRGGKIVSAAAGAANTAGLRVIDAKGMTAMPGYIDAHKHVDRFNKEQVQSLLEAGYTTILSAGGTAENNLKLVENIDSGAFNGPHIIPAASLPVMARDFETALAKGALTGFTPETGRAAIRDIAAKGIKHTGEIVMAPSGLSPEDVATMKAIVEEGKERGVQINVHAVSTPAMMGAVNAGVTHQVHMPNKDFMGIDDAKQINATGTIVLGLLAFGAPIVDRFSGPPAQVQFPKDDSPRFRDGKPWPESIAGANRDAAGRATGTEAGFTIVNARTIWDASNGQALGWCTDQNYDDKLVLEHELKSYSVMFSMADIFRIITINTARYLRMENQIGSIEPGKVADIILLQGNPLENTYPMLNTKVVLRGGKVVVDKR
jgi:imidazolonepropionase-like amidohydrolase